MKRLTLILILMLAPLAAFSQGIFDSYEGQKDVTSVVVTKNMFKLLADMDLESDDPEVKEYLDMVNNLDNIKIFMTENKDLAQKMANDVKAYVSSSSGLNELMRVNDEGKNIKFYSKEGKSDSFVSELLMFVDGNINGKSETIVMSITGNIDLKKIGKLTKELNVPGSDELENIEKKG